MGTLYVVGTPIGNLEDVSVKALSISGFAYTTDATPTRPQNMLMIIGKWDEYRERMTGVGDIEVEWMSSPQTQAAIITRMVAHGVAPQAATSTAIRTITKIVSNPLKRM